MDEEEAYSRGVNAARRFRPSPVVFKQAVDEFDEQRAGFMADYDVGERTCSDETPLGKHVGSQVRPCWNVIPCCSGVYACVCMT